MPAVYRTAAPREVPAPCARIALSLPLPPSKNNLTKRIGMPGGGYREVSTDARDSFLRGVELLVRGHVPLEGPLSAEVRVFMPSGGGDGHNVHELLFDALEGKAYRNDSQIRHIESWVEVDAEDPRVEVSFEQIR